MSNCRLWVKHRKLTLAVVLLLAVVGVIVVFAGDSTDTGAAGTFYVAVNGSDANSGADASPYRTIAKAAQSASGSTIIIREGRYHESVQVYNKTLFIEGQGDVYLDGSVQVGGWQPAGGDWWATWTKEFPVKTGLPVASTNPAAGYPDQMFYDNTQVTQVLTRAAVVPGTFFHDKPANRIYLGSDPNGHLVEGSDLSWGLYLNKAHGTTVTGITVRRYATQASDFAAVRAFGNDITVSDAVVEDNAYNGISFQGARDTIQTSQVQRNGWIGIHARQSSTLVVRNNTVIGNNAAGFEDHDAAGGIKVTNIIGLIIDSNHVAANASVGIWTDISTRGVQIIHNYSSNNRRSGIQVELSGDAIVAGNVANDNGEQGIWILESNDVKVWNNAAFSNLRDIWVEEGPRVSNDQYSWDLNRVALRNNVVGGGHQGGPALINCDDWTGKRSCANMTASSNWNAFWLPAASPTRKITRWGRWPTSNALSATLADARSQTGQEASSRLSTASVNPYVVDAAGLDFEMPASEPVGATPPDDVLAVLGVTGDVRPGPVRPSPLADRSVTPTPTPDTEAPKAPTELTSTVAARDVTLTWTASTDNVEVTGYVIFDRNIEVALSDATTFDLIGQTTGDHFYQILAFDVAGNRSVKTAPLLITIGA